MASRPPLGWIVEVEHPKGARLYAVRGEFADQAEDRLREALNIESGLYIGALRPVEPSMFESFRMAIHPITGPF